MACSKSFQRTENRAINVLDTVCDKMLERFPIRLAARTSVLSKRWRRAWLSLKKLNFDKDFWVIDGRRPDCRKYSSIISGVLFHHNGPVHEFHLFIPYDKEFKDWDGWIICHWVSFLSKNGVRKNVIRSDNDATEFTDVGSYIFRCSDLVHLHFNRFNLNRPPTDFGGFPNLKHLELVDCEFSKPNILGALIRNSRKLLTLKLVCWTGMNRVVIDAPHLQTLILKGDFESLEFRNIGSLKSICITFHCDTARIKFISGGRVVDPMKLLASSCQLQSIEINGRFCKLLAAGGITRSRQVTFNHVQELCLRHLNLSDADVFQYLLYMIKSCPYIRKLHISVQRGEIVDRTVLSVFTFLYNCKLNHLREVNIEGITGSCAELKLVKHVLAISAFLENLFFKSGNCNTEAELDMLRALIRLPRASPKASIVCMHH